MEPKAKRAASEAVYLAIDVGGTKIQASLITQAGVVLSRHRCPTPRTGARRRCWRRSSRPPTRRCWKSRFVLDQLTAVGIAIPGVVDPEKGWSSSPQHEPDRDFRRPAAGGAFRSSRGPRKRLQSRGTRRVVAGLGPGDRQFDRNSRGNGRGKRNRPGGQALDGRPGVGR